MCSSRLKTRASHSVIGAAIAVASWSTSATAAYRDFVTTDEVIQTAPPAQDTERFNPTGRDIALTAPLRDGALVLGEVDFTLAADDTIHIGAQRLLSVLRPVLAPDKASALEAVLVDQPQISLQALHGLGYIVTYDPATISLRIAIPAVDRPVQSIQIADLDRERYGDVTEPARFSAYLNARGSLDYVWDGAGKGLNEPSVLLNAAARYGGVVFETEGSYQGGASEPFIREGSRLVYDQLDKDSRWTLGDLQPTSRGFAGSTPMAGVSVVRSYTLLQPQRNVQPRGDQAFTLIRPSTVEAFINGQSVRQIRLQPGTYNVRDFPFGQGANDVQLIITDDAGGRETIEFSLFFDRSLLAPGLAEYAVYVGATTDFQGGQRSYSSDLVSTGFYRRGLSESLTGGANYQIQQSGAVIGGEIVWANPIGTLGVDVAASQNDGIGSGYAVNASFQRLFREENGRSRSLSATFETRSNNFTTPGLLLADNRFAYQAGVSYSQGLTEYQYISFDARYSAGRDIYPDESRLRVNYGLRLNSRVNFQVEGNYEDRALGKGFGARFSFTFRRSERSSVQGSYDSQTEQSRLGYQTSNGRGVGSWSADVDVTNANESNRVNGSYNRISNRAEWGVAQTASLDGGGGDVTDRRTSLRGGSAIVFADGAFGVSRPVFDSFAVVAPHSSLKDRTIVINPQADSFSSRSGWLGPAIANDLTSYSDRAVPYDVPDAPVGYDLGQGAFRVFPPYRAGYLVTVGSDYFITAIGRLLDSEGQPIPLLAGTAIEVGGQQRRVELFTNRDGRFGASGLRPGTWRIELPTRPVSVYTIVIPEGSDGVVTLADQRPEGQP